MTEVQLAALKTTAQVKSRLCCGARAQLRHTLSDSLQLGVHIGEHLAFNTRISSSCSNPCKDDDPRHPPVAPVFPSQQRHFGQRGPASIGLCLLAKHI